MNTSRLVRAESPLAFRRNLSVWSVPAVVGVIVLGAAASASAQAVFHGLSDLPGGGVGSLAYGVSADGLVVVGFGTSASGMEAFRWSAAGGMVGLGDLPGGIFQSGASGVSADGSVVVGFGRSAAGTEAFRWTQSGGIVGMGDLAGGQFSSAATGISRSGLIVVGRGSSAASGDQQEAFRWTQTGMAGLGDLAGSLFGSEAYATSGDGSVVVGASYSSNGRESFRWTQGGGMVSLGDLPGGFFNSEAWAVSDDATTIAGVATNSEGLFEAYRWTSATGMVALGVLPGGNPVQSEARGISGDGSIVVGFAVDAVGIVATIWDSVHGMRDLNAVLVNDHGVNLAGWRLQLAWAITPDGRTIVGWGAHNGVTEAWRVTLPPPVCYPNCDGSTVAPALNVADFICFLNKFAAQDSYANCDGSTLAPVLNVGDFICFLNKYAAGCP